MSPPIRSDLGLAITFVTKLDMPNQGEKAGKKQDKDKSREKKCRGTAEAHTRPQ